MRPDSKLLAVAAVSVAAVSVAAVSVAAAASVVAAAAVVERQARLMVELLERMSTETDQLNKNKQWFMSDALLSWGGVVVGQWQGGQSGRVIELPRVIELSIS